MPAAGVPAKDAVPLLLSVRVTPLGKALPVLVIAAVGMPEVVTEKLPAWPAWKVVASVLVKAGGIPIRVMVGSLEAPVLGSFVRMVTGFPLTVALMVPWLLICPTLMLLLMVTVEVMVTDLPAGSVPIEIGAVRK